MAVCPHLFLCMFVKSYWFVEVDSVSCCTELAVSKSFLVELSGSLMYHIISTNRGSLTSFPICIPLISFCCLIAPSSISSMMLKRTGDV